MNQIASPDYPIGANSACRVGAEIEDGLLSEACNGYVGRHVGRDVEFMNVRCGGECRGLREASFVRSASLRVVLVHVNIEAFHPNATCQGA